MILKYCKQCNIKEKLVVVMYSSKDRTIKTSNW